jgi:hypothetical protein
MFYITKQGSAALLIRVVIFSRRGMNLRTLLRRQPFNHSSLNTHCHLDHVFGNKMAAKKWDLTLHIHEKEKPVLDFAPQSGEMWQMPLKIMMAS